MTDKVCSKCHTLKPLDDYCRHAKGFLGRASECKDCAKKYRQQSDVRERTRVRQRNRKRIRKYNPETLKKWHQKQKEILSDSYLANLISGRTGVPVQAIKQHPILIELERANKLLKRSVPKDIVIIKELPIKRDKPIKVKKQRIKTPIEELKRRSAAYNLKKYHMNKDANREKHNSNSRRHRVSLSDSYIRTLIMKNTDLAYNDIPQSLIEEKRQQLIIKRLNKNQKK